MTLPCPPSPPHGNLIQIYWHNKMPIYSVHFQPHSTFNEEMRFATGGADAKVRIWSLNASGCSDNQHQQVSFIATLSKHSKGVNVVRWNPQGNLLCSASDGGALFIWHCIGAVAAASTEKPTSSSSCASMQESSLLDDEEPAGLECWKVRCALETCNPFDIYAVEWSPCGSFVAAGLSDDTCRIYSVKEGSASGQCLRVLREHSHFVVGIAWDPMREFLVTCSSDRTLKIVKTKLGGVERQQQQQRIQNKISFVPWMRIHRMAVGSASEKCCSQQFYSSPVASHSQEIEELEHSSQGALGFKLFHDESLGSFFRKPAFSPCGGYLYVAGGLAPASNAFQEAASGPLLNCVHIFIRNGFHLNNPICSIGGFDKPAVGVFFCSGMQFKPSRSREIRGQEQEQDWEWIFCILTCDEVHVFGTGRLEEPLWIAKGFHLATLTDATWSMDGTRLVVASADGFASVFVFEWSERREVKRNEKCESVERVDLCNDGDKQSVSSNNGHIKSVNSNDGDKQIVSSNDQIVQPIPLNDSIAQSMCSNDNIAHSSTLSSNSQKGTKRIAPTLISPL